MAKDEYHKNPVRIADQYVCPGCLHIYGIGDIYREYPTCSYCASEAADLFVQPLDDFLSEWPITRLEERLRAWRTRTGLTEGWKAFVERQLLYLIEVQKLGGKQPLAVIYPMPEYLAPPTPLVWNDPVTEATSRLIQRQALRKREQRRMAAIRYLIVSLVLVAMALAAYFLFR